MKKQKLRITIVTDNSKKIYNLLGEYDKINQTIKYKESDSLLTNVSLDLNNKLLVRENKDYYLEYQLLEAKETINKLILKEFNQQISLKIKTERFLITNSKVEIIYTIVESQEKIDYQIEF